LCLHIPPHPIDMQRLTDRPETQNEVFKPSPGGSAAPAKNRNMLYNSVLKHVIDIVQMK